VAVAPSKKSCKHCGQVKLASDFGPEVRNLDGLSGVCRRCTNVASNKKRKIRYATTPDRFRKMARDSYRRNKKAASERRREYYQANKTKSSEYFKRWYQDHPDKILAKNARRRAAKARRTVAFDQDGISHFYKIAAAVNENWRLVGSNRMTVDHVVPLCGESVSGLHVASNLQVISLSRNSAKCNKFGN